MSLIRFERATAFFNGVAYPIGTRESPPAHIEEAVGVYAPCFPDATFQCTVIEHDITRIRWDIRCWVRGREAIEEGVLYWAEALKESYATDFRDCLTDAVVETMRRVFLGAGGRFESPRAFRFQRRSAKHLKEVSHG